MTERVQVGGLQIATELYDPVARESAPGTGVDPDTFWTGLGRIVDELGPRNKALLAKRDELQAQIDAWHKERKGQAFDLPSYKQFLTEIGYLQPEGPDFQIGTENVDAEIAQLAGPQLVVPVMNARYALNAANARWGSLYDALYGTDVIPETGGAEKGGGYKPARGEKVIAYARELLDRTVPLAQGSHKDATGYLLKDDGGRKQLAGTPKDGSETGLKDPAQFVGYIGGDSPSSVLLKHNGLHIEIQIDRDSPIGKTDPAGVKDVVLEAAL